MKKNKVNPSKGFLCHLALLVAVGILSLAIAIPESIADYRCSVVSEEHAKNIAFNALLKKYGDSVYDELPLDAELIKGFWLVSGTIQTSPEEEVQRLGGVGYAIIEQDSCKVIYLIHEE